MRSSPSRLLSALTCTLDIMPEIGELTTVSIFIALSTQRGWPFSTFWPGFTFTSTTLPGMGAPTCPRTSFKALGWKCISWRSRKQNETITGETREAMKYLTHFPSQLFPNYQSSSAMRNMIKWTVKMLTIRKIIMNLCTPQTYVSVLVIYIFLIDY